MQMILGEVDPKCPYKCNISLKDKNFEDFPMNYALISAASYVSKTFYNLASIQKTHLVLIELNGIWVSAKGLESTSIVEKS